jgi:hypothetical protein
MQAAIKYILFFVKLPHNLTPFLFVTLLLHLKNKFKVLSYCILSLIGDTSPQFHQCTVSTGIIMSAGLNKQKMFI